MKSDRKNLEAAQKLLWHGLDQPKRGRRHSLTMEHIVEAGLTVAERGGVGTLSMRAVAQELGVGVASLYTYVPNKSALLALMADTMIGQLPLPHTLPGNWRQQTETWARDELTAFRTYPWLADFDDSRAVGPRAVAWLNSAISVFQETGISTEDALTVVDTISAYIRGHVIPVLAEDQLRQWSGPDGQQWDTSAAAFRASYDPEPGRYPALESIDAYPSAVEIFEAGLKWLLDGVAAQLSP